MLQEHSQTKCLVQPNSEIVFRTFSFPSQYHLRMQCSMFLLLHSGVIGDRQGHSKGQWLGQPEIGLRLSPTLPLPVQTLTSSSHKYPESPSSVSPDTINLHTLEHVQAHYTLIFSRDFFGSSKTSPYTFSLLQEWDILVLNLQLATSSVARRNPKPPDSFCETFFFSPPKGRRQVLQETQKLSAPAHFLCSAPSTTTKSITRICRKGEDLRFHTKSTTKYNVDHKQ